MCTAPANTFIDYAASPAVAAAVSAAPIPRTSSETLVDVIRDDERRNKLIDDNNLLKGVRMTALGPAVSSRELIVRPSTLHAAVNQNASIHTTTVEAEYTEKLLESNYTAVSIQVSAPYVTASVDFSQETSWENTETTKTVAVSSRYLFPQGRIDFARPGSGFAGEVVLSEHFTALVDAALEKSTLTEQREALDAVFNEYGQIFRSRVQIGGTLSAHTSETYSRTENETSVKRDITASLEVAVQNWGLGISSSHGNLETTITTAENRVLDVKYLVQGGDYTQILDTDAWIASTDDSGFWRVVEVTEVTATVDLLPEPKRSVVKRLMVPLLGEWVPVAQVPYTEGFPVRIYQPRNPIPSGWFWVGHSADGSRALIVKPTLPRKTGRNYPIADARQGASNQPRPAAARYEFLSTYFSGFDPSTRLGQTFAALRPGLFLEGEWRLVGTNINTLVYITSPRQHQGEEDECLDLQSVIQLRLPGNPSDHPPRPRWAIRKNAVLFNSGET